MTVLFTPFIDWNLKEMALTFPPPPRIDVLKKKKNGPYIWSMACWLQVNNDRSRDYTIPNTTPMVNSQPSILGQQPTSVMGSAVQYSGASFTPSQEQPGIPQQTSAGWGPGVPPMPQSMPMQMHNNPYMPPGTMPPQAAPGMMQSPMQSGMPQSSMLPRYGSGQMQ